MTEQKPFMVFSGTATRYLAEKICQSLGCPLGNLLVTKFSDGEFAVYYEESIRGRDVFLVQSTFLKIWKMRDDVRDDADAISGLAFTIARNLRKNLARDKAHLTFVGEIRDSDDGVVGDAETSPIGTTERLDTLPQHRETSQSDTEYLRKRLLEAFAKLPPILRDAYTMFQVGEMSVRDIANQTGVSENLVKVRIFRAKEKLKTILADLHVTF